MTEKLLFTNQPISKEYFGSHVELLIEFIKKAKPEIIKEELEQIYTLLKEVIDVVLRQDFLHNKILGHYYSKPK